MSTSTLSPQQITEKLSTAVEHFGQNPTTVNARPVIDWLDKMGSYSPPRGAGKKGPQASLTVKDQAKRIKDDYRKLMNARPTRPFGAQNSIDAGVFRQPIGQALPAANNFNRLDYVEHVNRELAGKKSPIYLALDPVFPDATRPTPPSEMKSGPEAPTSLIPIHGTDLEMIKSARPGGALVCLAVGRPDKPEKPVKIYALEVTPSVGSSGDKTKAYAVAAPEMKERRIFRNRDITTPPLIHLNKKIPKAPMAHRQMIALLEKKYGAGALTGQTVGFTIIKGDGETVGNKYNFKSASINDVTFTDKGQHKDSQPPVAWQNAIIASVETQLSA